MAFFTVMVEDSSGSGRFVKVTLNPTITITQASMISEANKLHKRANELCFIANSVNFPVGHHPNTIATALSGRGETS